MIVGTRNGVNHNTTVNSLRKDPITKYANQFKNLCEDVLKESGIDLFSEPHKALMVSASNNAIKNYFMEGISDLYAEDVRSGLMDAEELEEKLEDASEQYNNDVEAIQEATALGSYNPVIGMTFPVHKNIMMNNVFDKGAIPKVVAVEPKFTISMEQRFLVTPDGEEIDMYAEQNKMSPAMRDTVPFKEITLVLPRYDGDNIGSNAKTLNADGTQITVTNPTDNNILAGIGFTQDDNVSIASYICAVKTKAWYTSGDKLPDGTTTTTTGWQDVWCPVEMRFTPGYGDHDRTIMCDFSFSFTDKTTASAPVSYTVKDTLSGYTYKNKFCLSSTNQATYTVSGSPVTQNVIQAVKLKARVDTSTAMINTCSVKWSVRTDIVEIPEAVPLNTTVSPEEVKDIGALYQVNQLSKILYLLKVALGNLKDDEIKENLDISFLTMPARSKIAATFDFAPRAGYAFDHVEWRYKTFMDAMDTYVTQLLQVLNDPNMTITVFGRPDLIRKLTPTEYTYQVPSSIGAVDLDFAKTVVTSNNRVYQFISSDKLRDNNNLIVILCPRDSTRIVYRIYDYQMYVSNEIRNPKNYTLPAIHAFERWLFKSYQPVQARVKILNPTGLRYEIANSDADSYALLSHNDYNDYTANAPESTT